MFLEVILIVRITALRKTTQGKQMGRGKLGNIPKNFPTLVIVPTHSIDLRPLSSTKRYQILLKTSLKRLKKCFNKRATRNCDAILSKIWKNKLSQKSNKYGTQIIKIEKKQLYFIDCWIYNQGLDKMLKQWVLAIYSIKLGKRTLRER